MFIDKKELSVNDFKDIAKNHQAMVSSLKYVPDENGNTELIVTFFRNFKHLPVKFRCTDYTMESINLSKKITLNPEYRQMMIQKYDDYYREALRFYMEEQRMQNEHALD